VNAWSTARVALRRTRGLRFRLTLSYVVFFALLLIMIGVLFRPALQQIMYGQSEDILNEEWGGAKGYLRIEKYGPDWFYDAYDPEEGLVVNRLRNVYLLTNDQGVPIEHSHIYDTLGLDSPDDIKAVLESGQATIRVRRDPHGVPYMIRAGRLTTKPDKSFKYGNTYYLAIGRSLQEENQILDKFTVRYFMVLPGLIALSSLFGWFMAGRALTPVNSVAHTAQRISGSSLDLRIPLRGADDELDHLIETFNHMMDRLKASFDQIRQFSTDVSHELRTPLTVIRGQLEVALFTAKTPEQYREGMVNALEDVDRLALIVRALLLLSQSETGQLVLQKTHFDLAELARDLVAEFQIPAEERDVRVTAAASPACPVTADRIQMERLITNLLSNAIKYTQHGGEAHVAVNCDGTNVVLTVEDNGVGIPVEHLPHIFDRFYKVPSSDPEKGLGLGLSFVAWIARAHGGSVDVASEPGRGTRFTVHLPVGAPATAEKPVLAGSERLH
jgi:heavy metal sensor kinase